MSNYKQYIIKRKKASNYEPHMLGGDAFLAHHGILGMKWGVRRYQNPDGSYTAAGRARYGVGEKEYRPGSKRNRIGVEDDIYISAGNKAYRVSRNQSDTKSTRYITVEKGDNAFYAHSWSDVSGQGSTAYQHTYDIKKDIKIPSLKKRVEICNELYTKENIKEIAKCNVIDNYYNGTIKDSPTNEEVAKRVGINTIEDVRDILEGKRTGVLKDSVTGYKVNCNEIRKGLQEDLKGAIKHYQLQTDPLARANSVSAALHGSPKLMAQYGKKVLERGYNATLDDHGADATALYRMAKLPIISFDANNSLVQSGSKIITDAEKRSALKKARKEFTEMNVPVNTRTAKVGMILGTALGAVGGALVGGLPGGYIGGYSGAAAGLLAGAKVAERSTRSLAPTISDYRYDKKLGYRKRADAQIIAAYKREHPNTKLSNNEIIKNYFGGN